jgi:hypothetical protein
MHHARPIRDSRGQSRPNPFGMCRYTTPIFKSFSFCRYETPSYLHIPQDFKSFRICRYAATRANPFRMCRYKKGGTPIPLAARARGLRTEKAEGQLSLFFGLPSTIRRLTSNFRLSNGFHTPSHSQNPNSRIFNRLRTPLGEGGRDIYPQKQTNGFCRVLFLPAFVELIRLLRRTHIEARCGRPDCTHRDAESGPLGWKAGV